MSMTRKNDRPCRTAYLRIARSQLHLGISGACFRPMVSQFHEPCSGTAVAPVGLRPDCARVARRERAGTRVGTPPGVSASFSAARSRSRSRCCRGSVRPLTLVVANLGAILVIVVTERLLPYRAEWNRAHGDLGTDLLHADRLGGGHGGGGAAPGAGRRRGRGGDAVADARDRALAGELAAGRPARARAGDRRAPAVLAASLAARARSPLALPRHPPQRAAALLAERGALPPARPRPSSRSSAICR